VQIECPYCRETSVVDAELEAGQHVRCAYCGRKFDYMPQSEPEVYRFDVGQVVGAYRIVRCIGEGGMGAVYEVVHAKLGAHYAMKVFTLSEGDAHEHLLRQKFLEEAKQLSAINHPNVAHVFDLEVDEKSGVPYFVMDLVTYVGGEPCTLDDIDCSQVSEDLVFQWFTEMCGVLDYVHSLGVIHRDIKLANILLNAHQHVVLTDFGVAKVFEGVLHRAVQGGCKTEGGQDYGMVFGTEHYMAPEITDGKAVTAAADVYSLGVAFFRMLTGTWYDEHPEAISRLSQRKYRWVSVLSAMLAPIARRPTILSALPGEASRNVAKTRRHTGTWKIVLSDNRGKTRLHAAMEKARWAQEETERRRLLLKRGSLLLVAGLAILLLRPGCQWVNRKMEEREICKQQAAADARHKEEENRQRIEREHREIEERKSRVKAAYHARNNRWEDVLSRCRKIDVFRDAIAGVKRRIKEVKALVRAESYPYDDAQTKEVISRSDEIQALIDALERNEKAYEKSNALHHECWDGLEKSSENPLIKVDVDVRRLFEEAKKVVCTGNDCAKKQEFHRAVQFYSRARELLRECVRLTKAKEEAEMSAKRQAMDDKAKVVAEAQNVLARVKETKDFERVRKHYNEVREKIKTTKDRSEYGDIVAPLESVEQKLACMEEFYKLVQRTHNRKIEVLGRQQSVRWQQSTKCIVLEAGNVRWDCDWWSVVVSNQKGLLSDVANGLIRKQPVAERVRLYLGAALTLKAFSNEVPENKKLFAKWSSSALEDDRLRVIIESEFPEVESKGVHR